ncbi:MAG: ORF6N domain-containing protein [Elusimicrobia bacterium]|nr:ORF6N domain-containing protein [Elusimicrobiota bacterium]
MTIPDAFTETPIHRIRGRRVMLDAELAVVYGVRTKRLNEQVRRNRGRFPQDFVFQLTPAEKAEVVANCDHLQKLRFSSTLPFAFTEHGAVMLAAVLNSPRAVRASVGIARAFVRLRRLAFGRRELAARLKELEGRVGTHDGEIRELFEALGAMVEGPDTVKKIGFHP